MTICDRRDAGDLPVDTLVAAREGSGNYGRIVNGRQNVLTERTSRRSQFALIELDLASDPGKDITHWYVPHPTSMDLASLIHCSVARRVYGLGSLTGAAPSAHVSYFSLEIDFEEVPAR